MSDKPDDKPAETPESTPDETPPESLPPPGTESPETAGPEAVEPSPAPARPPATGRLGVVIGVLALLLALAGLGGAWQLWRLQQDLAGRISGLASDTAARFGELAGSLETLRSQDAALRQQIAAVQSEQKNVADALSELLRRSAHLQKQWLVAEARYLIRLAGQRLSLTRDVQTAITALRAADRRLREVGDPAILPVRKALAGDIDALEQVPMPDVTGLALKLGALIADVDRLPLIRKPGEEPAETDADAPADDKPVGDWRDLPAAMWSDLKKLVIIRQHEGGVKPLLSPDQHFFLVQNLKLQLEQARLALLQGNLELWRESLETARQWLETWFDKDAATTRHLRDSLQQLAAIDIAPALPMPAHSEAAIAEYLARTDTGAQPAEAAP